MSDIFVRCCRPGVGWLSGGGDSRGDGGLMIVEREAMGMAAGGGVSDLESELGFEWPAEKVHG